MEQHITKWLQVIYGDSDIKEVRKNKDEVVKGITDLMSSDNGKSCAICAGMGHESGTICPTYRRVVDYLKNMGGHHEAKFFASKFNEVWKGDLDRCSLQIGR